MTILMLSKSGSLILETVFEIDEYDIEKNNCQPLL